ncbi:MAG: class I tRNA ligase family protein, partial [bacterium]
TMDASYTESVWWVFKQLHDKGLVYEGFKSMHLCPRCETTLSNFEVTQGYKDVTDISVYAKFAIKDEPNTFFVAWTTTPWTLPGNVALAVGAEIVYAKVKVTDAKTGVVSQLIIAKEKLAAVMKDVPHEVLAEMKGSELVGKEYTPVFSYYFGDTKLKNLGNAWKVYVADFVTLEKGTGIVHIAPAFGEDDYQLSLKMQLPFIQHVGTDGAFKKEVADFAGQQVKPKSSETEKDAHQKTDVEIIKYLAQKGTLFAKEKIIHSYPHCWRCETPLLNYASSSWFVKVTDFKDKLVAENKKVKWVPEEIGEGRFGNWLENARDWAISRSRFWGAPLPVWKCQSCEQVKVVGGIADMKRELKPRNTYYVMRHGEAEHNVLRVMSTDLAECHHLTEKGKQQALKAGEFLKDKKIDVIFASPFLRTQETMKEVCEVIGFDHKKIVKDARIGEIRAGVLNGGPVDDYRAFFSGSKFAHFTKRPEGGENYGDLRARISDFLYDVDARYEGKTILIVTHDSPAWFLSAAADAMTDEQALVLRGRTEFFLKNAEVRPLSFVQLSHNAERKLDLHRPHIDAVTFACACGGQMKRVPEVFDCWFESGSMPYGAAHYPFEKDSNFRPATNAFDRLFGRFTGRTRGYSANFIAEGLDQTRGWFYSMLVLGVALFGKSPYKQVVVNGLILAEDGRKMSKSLKNYPDPMKVVEQYGADALRFYLLSSPVVRGQDLCFSEKGVDEVAKKLLGRLDNVRSFYELYADASVKASNTSSHVLDRWILARLAELLAEVTKGFEAYELDKVCRPFNGFVDDLSTWYLRRSRDRFKNTDGAAAPEAVADKQAALATTRFVLRELSKALAPIMPFYAEALYLSLKTSGNTEDAALRSVHLEDWSRVGKVCAQSAKAQKQIIADMAAVRATVSLGLEARMQAKINVRQPLAKLSVKQVPKGADAAALLELVKDEVNVKSVAENAALETPVLLDTVLTPELKEEGIIRDMIRAVQELRKQSGLNPSDRVDLFVDTDAAGKTFVQKHQGALTAVTGVKQVRWEIVQQGTHLEFEGMKFGLKL